MLKTRLTSFFNSIELPSVDGPSIVAEIVSNPVYWVSNADKLEHYKGFSLESPTTLTCATVITYDQYKDLYTVSSVVDVKRSLLTGLLSEQLGYVPEFAILEFYMGGENSAVMCRETIICSSLEKDGTRNLAAISKGVVPAEVHEAFEKTPEADRVWLHVALATARKLTWTAEKSMGLANQTAVTVAVPPGSNYVH